MKCKANCSNAGTNLQRGDWLLHRTWSPPVQSHFEKIACSFKNIYFLSAVVGWL